MPPDRDTTRLHVTYRISCADGEDPAAKARDIAYEQTVELPADSVSPAVVARSVGRVETLEPAGDGCWRAVISFDAGLVGAGDVPQLLNLLFGNISLKAGIELTGLEWPRALLDQLGGPRFGIDGLRSLTGVRARPLLCAAVKPVGLPSRRSPTSAIALPRAASTSSRTTTASRTRRSLRSRSGEAAARKASCGRIVRPEGRGFNFP